ncbi:MAG: right-handed parallel beta-helix repeat-containing protein [Candidatus Thermoplasmatota archaeon]|nr:right-handed parallel beta-helix repeat-containing protein [Candidatus Thermoplasmatota archaeon]
MWADSRRASVILALTLLSASLLAAVVLMPGTATATTRYVGGGGPGNYTSIQAAIDNADPGDTVYVYAGTYREMVRINKTLSLVGENRDTTIIKDIVPGGLVSVQADWVNVTGFSLVGEWSYPSMVGMNLWYSRNCTISNNIFLRNWYGLSLHDSSYNTIADNAFVENWNGLELSSSPDNRIHDNEILHNHGYGMYIYTSANVTISRNNISSNGGGLHMEGTTYDIIKANTFLGNGIYMRGGSVSHFSTHKISTDNMVNGRPIHYYRDRRGLNVDGTQLGQLIIANCTGVNVSNLHINGTDVGIQLGYVSGATISGNNVSTNGQGILLWFSERMTIADNDVWGNGGGISPYYSRDITLRENRIFTNSTIHCSSGIHPFRSTDVSIIGNTISRCGESVYIQNSENLTISMNEFFSGAEGVRTWVSANLTINGNNFSEYSTGIRSFYSTNITVTRNKILSSEYAGIRFQDGHDITITGNSIAESERGIALENTSSALIHHNNLINNTLQAYDDMGANNSWDDGYPSGGNYWSDYEGVDNCSGPNQDNCPDPDGIGDTPYVIDGDTRDNYPLMAPWSPPIAWNEVLYGPVRSNATQVWSPPPEVPLSSGSGSCGRSPYSASTYVTSLASQSASSQEISVQMVTRQAQSP